MTKIRRFYKNELFHEILFLSLAFLCMMILYFFSHSGKVLMKSTVSVWSVLFMKTDIFPGEMIRLC